jgi:hypothetical protein
LINFTVEKNKNNTSKVKEDMKAFVFLINGSYESVISTNQRQAEKDMCDKCIAAFASVALADKFVEMMNNSSK